MAMQTKEKVLLILILVVVAICLLFSHFCGGALDAFEHFIASGFASAPRAARFVAASSSVLFLPRLA